MNGSELLPLSVTFPKTMSAQAIPGLLEPPEVLQSRHRVLEIVNAKFSCLEDLEGIESAAAEAEHQNDQLQQKVRFHTR